MGRLVVLKMGSSFPSMVRAWGDFEDWILEQLAWPAPQVDVIDVRHQPPLPSPHACAGVILTGSHSMVTDQEAWSERVAKWIPKTVEAGIPLLGICYGHQLLAHALSGQVGPNPAGPEFGTVEMSIHPASAADPLFAEITGCVPVQTSHFQSVLKLPPGATCLASTSQDPHHAFAVGRRAWGVQFHPEYRVEMARAYIDHCTEPLVDSGLQPAELRRNVSDTPVARSLLGRFREIVRSQSDFGPDQ